MLLDQTSDQGEASDTTQRDVASTVYYVRSSQRSSRHASVDMGTSYEVRVRAWNCTCPGFAFAAFSGAAGADYDSSQEFVEEAASERGEDKGERWGGFGLGNEVPLCKHLLACALADRCKRFEGFVEEKVVGRDEMAGWAGGWGG